jgi:predicted HicB family RNase H-like nuclease
MVSCSLNYQMGLIIAVIAIQENTNRGKIMSAMLYKKYAARIEYSDEDNCFIGHIAGTNDIVGFHGESVRELHAAFEEAVEDYLSTCKKLGKSPQKLYSGRIMLRIPPAIHAKAARFAEAHGKSLNTWVAEVLDKAA